MANSDPTIDVNSPPVNSLPPLFAGDLPGGVAWLFGISVADPDAGDGAMRTTLSVQNGTLTVAGVDGATVGGSGTHTVTIDGTLAQINATLSTIDNVEYHPVSFAGDTLTMTSDDMGHTGPDPNGPSLTDTDTALIVMPNVDPRPNFAPTDILLSHASVDEFAGNGTVVGTLSDVDANPGDTAAFTLLDDAGGRFAISGDELVVADSVRLDYEQQAAHDVTVRVTDSGGLTFDKVLAIGLNDVNPEMVTGGGAADVIVGGALGDIINGAGGNDTIVGGDGDDKLGGGAGDDIINGGNGNDTIWGEDGKDILGGGAGDDIIVGMDGDDTIWGEDGNDTINGGTGADIVLGGAGNDHIGGGSGNDDLRGDAGNDTLWGEDGNDVLSGGPGDDVLIGGAGSDTFIFHPGDGADIVTDFTPAGAQSDRIWLAGTDLHSFADVLAHASFNPATGATTITHDGTGSIVLNGVALGALTANDFVFT